MQSFLYSIFFLHFSLVRTPYFLYCQFSPSEQVSPSLLLLFFFHIVFSAQHIFASFRVSHMDGASRRFFAVTKTVTSMLWKKRYYLLHISVTTRRIPGRMEIRSPHAISTKNKDKERTAKRPHDETAQVHRQMAGTQGRVARG